MKDRIRTSSEAMKETKKIRYTKTKIFSLIMVLCLLVGICSGCTSDKKWHGQEKSNKKISKNLEDATNIPANEIYGSHLDYKIYTGEEEREGSEHAKSALEDSESFKPFLSIAEFNDSVSGGILDLITRIKYISIDDITSAFMFGEKSISQLFIETFVKDENGKIQPALVIFLFLWICSMFIAGKNTLIGQGGMQEVWKEVGALLISIVLFTVVVSTDNLNSISSLSINLANSMSNSVIESSNNQSGDSFWSLDGVPFDKNGDVVERAMISKGMIDGALVAFFDVDKVEDLDIKELFGEDNGEYSVSNGTNKVSNVGYLYYAGGRGVNTSEPIKGGKINKDKDRSHYKIIDLLDKHKGTHEEEVSQIYDSITNPDQMRIYASSFIRLFSCLSFGFFNIEILYFIFLGKIICSVGVMVLVLLPFLVLYKKTRSFAMSFWKFYFSGFIRVLIGFTVNVIAVSAYVALVCNSNILFNIMAIPLFIFLTFWFHKDMIPFFERLFVRVGGDNVLSNIVSNYSRSTFGRNKSAAQNIMQTTRDKFSKKKKTNDENDGKDSEEREIKNNNEKKNDGDKMAEAEERELLQEEVKSETNEETEKQTTPGTQSSKVESQDAIEDDIPEDIVSDFGSDYSKDPVVKKPNTEHEATEEIDTKDIPRENITTGKNTFIKDDVNISKDIDEDFGSEYLGKFDMQKTTADGNHSDEVVADVSDDFGSTTSTPATIDSDSLESGNDDMKNSDSKKEQKQEQQNNGKMFFKDVDFGLQDDDKENTTYINDSNDHIKSGGSHTGGINNTGGRFVGDDTDYDTNDSSPGDIDDGNDGIITIIEDDSGF